jgi:3-dehydroquinate dehydratase-2
MKKILVLNGPNLNRLGKREPGIYGSDSLDNLQAIVEKEANRLKIEVEFIQSNHEGELVDAIHSASENGTYGVISNPAAYTHTSVALRDAIASTELKVVEVHISNIYKREEFRHTSYTAPVSVGVISGLGFYGYIAALNYLADLD